MTRKELISAVINGDKSDAVINDLIEIEFDYAPYDFLEAFNGTPEDAEARQAARQEMLYRIDNCKAEEVEILNIFFEEGGG